MINEIRNSPARLDALGLFLAGLINTFLALFVAGVLLAPGTISQQTNLLARINWIAENQLLWQLGWLFWFAVTLSFAWSYFAIGRHLRVELPWVSLAIGIAVIAAAVDIVGVVINITVIPEIAQQWVEINSEYERSIEMLYQSLEGLAYALINVTAFGLYSVAGLLLLPAAFSTPDYPRWLAWLGILEWVIAFLATILLMINRELATGPLLISFSLYAPWVWGSAWWLLRRGSISADEDRLKTQ